MSQLEGRRLRWCRGEKNRYRQVPTLTAGYRLLLTELKSQKVLVHAGVPLRREIARMADIFARRCRRKLGGTTAVQIVHVAVQKPFAELGSTIRVLLLHTLPRFTRLLLQSLRNDPLRPEQLRLMMQVAEGLMHDIAADSQRQKEQSHGNPSTHPASLHCLVRAGLSLAVVTIGGELNWG